MLFCRPAEFRSGESSDKALSAKLAYQAEHKKPRSGLSASPAATTKPRGYKAYCLFDSLRNGL